MRYTRIVFLGLLILACGGNMQQFDGRLARLEKRVGEVEVGSRGREETSQAQEKGIKQQTAEVKLALQNIDELVARVEDITRDLEQRQQDVAALLDDLTTRVVRLERPVSVAQDSSVPKIEATAREIFDRARMDLDAGHPELAAMGFRSFIDQYPQSLLSDDAQFMLGECHYVGDRFEDALPEYEQLLDEYPASDKRALAMLRSGMCLMNVGRVDHAVSMLRGLMEVYPGTREAIAARERLADIP